MWLGFPLSSALILESSGPWSRGPVLVWPASSSGPFLKPHKLVSKHVNPSKPLRSPAPCVLGHLPPSHPNPPAFFLTVQACFKHRMDPFQAHRASMRFANSCDTPQARRVFCGCAPACENPFQTHRASIVFANGRGVTTASADSWYSEWPLVAVFAASESAAMLLRTVCLQYLQPLQFTVLAA